MTGAQLGPAISWRTSGHSVHFGPRQALGCFPCEGQPCRETQGTGCSVGPAECAFSLRGVLLGGPRGDQGQFPQGCSRAHPRPAGVLPCPGCCSLVAPEQGVCGRGEAGRPGLGAGAAHPGQLPLSSGLQEPVGAEHELTGSPLGPRGPGPPLAPFTPGLPGDPLLPWYPCGVEPRQPHREGP